MSYVLIRYIKLFYYSNRNKKDLTSDEIDLDDLVLL